jgi:aquaporin Z
VPRSMPVMFSSGSPWGRYASELAALGTFMVSAAAVTALLEHPSSPIHAALPNATARRALMGVAMGLTAAGIIYSPLGRFSGAHMNPAVTVTFLRLGAISRHDAAGYVIGQFLGGILGLAAVAVPLGPWISHPSVNYIATQPALGGAAVALVAEAAMSFVMMLAVLLVSTHVRFARYAGAAAATLIALFITVEAPLSGMSLNPARSFGPVILAQMCSGLWIYFIAPPLGMLAAAEVFVRVHGPVHGHCAAP